MNSKCDHSPLMFISVVFLLVGDLRVYAEPLKDTCSAFVRDIPVRTTQATASTWANIRNRVGSISYESNAIFNAAKDQAESLTPPRNFCPNGCAVSRRARLFFRSAPQKTMQEYKDAGYCAQLEKQTLEKPLRYETAEARSVEDLNDWIADLSQGKGKQGEELYEKCDRSCSPKYEYTVARTGETPGEYIVRAVIVCGAARDKDNNMYDLEAFFRWICEPQ